MSRTSDRGRTRELELNQRERLILRSVVQNYILNANPVGSRTLARRGNIDMSPATIRNTMSDLEELGLLTHPHTSAGRQPTDLGYRYYVNDLMQVEELSPSEKKVMDDLLRPISSEVTDLLDRISEILAEISRLLSIIVAPSVAAGVLKRIELIPLAVGRLMVVIIVRSGLVRTINLEVQSDITATEISDAEQYLNQRLNGLRLADIPNRIRERLKGDQAVKNAVVRLFLDLPNKIFTEEQRSEMHLGGVKNVVELPEYAASPEKLKGVIELIEDRNIIVHLFKERRQGVTVTIGNENPREQFRDFSVITSTYRIGDTSGTLGIIGPTRMNYGRLVALVDYAARLVTERVNAGLKKNPAIVTIPQRVTSKKNRE